MPMVNIDVDDVQSVSSSDYDEPRVEDRFIPPAPKLESILKIDGKVPEIVYSLHLQDKRNRIIDRETIHMSLLIWKTSLIKLCRPAK